MNGIQFHLRFSSSYTTLASLANRLFFSSSMPTHLLFPWTICYRFELRILKTDNIYSNILNFILFLCVRRACRSYRKLSSLYRPKSGWIKRSALFFSSGIEKKNKSCLLGNRNLLTSSYGIPMYDTKSSTSMYICKNCSNISNTQT